MIVEDMLDVGCKAGGGGCANTPRIRTEIGTHMCLSRIRIISNILMISTASCYYTRMNCVVRNSRGQTVRQVLINGASWGHYSYLQNGGHAIHSLSAEGRRLWGMGTCTNEALHSEFNNTQRVTVQQHVESMRAVISMFSLAKLLAHQSAAYLCDH